MKDTLTKARMAERLFDELGLNKREAKEIVELFFEEVRGSLADNTRVKISGFGNFDLRDKRERPGRNPKTGEEIPIRRAASSRSGSQKLKAHGLKPMRAHQNSPLRHCPDAGPMGVVRGTVNRSSR